jgi:mannosyltransferase OCH1-like enzyme
MIPKIIHQTWSDDPLPQILKYIRDENIKLLKDKGYEFIFETKKHWLFK